MTAQFKCSNCDRPLANDSWCAECLEKPCVGEMKKMAAKGWVRDSGRRRQGLTVWVVTDEGQAEFYRYQNLLN
jgi:hypothetical protein